MHGALKRIGFALVVIAAFTAGQIARDAFTPPWAEASSVGGSAQPGTGSGSLVGATSPTLTTPELGVATGTSLTLTQGVSAVTGTFTNGITITRSSAGAAVTGTGNGAGAGGSFTGGVNPAGHGVVAQAGNSAGAMGVLATGIGSGSSYAVDAYGGNNSTGNAIRARADGNSTTGLPLVITGDATSPAVGHIRFTVGDTNPTSCQVGDLFMFTGGVLRVCTATTPTWVNVGSQ